MGVHGNPSYFVGAIFMCWLKGKKLQLDTGLFLNSFISESNNCLQHL